MKSSKFKCMEYQINKMMQRVLFYTLISDRHSLLRILLDFLCYSIILFYPQLMMIGAWSYRNVLTQFFWGVYSQKNKNFKIKNKENKISRGRGNSLRIKVKGWVDLDSPDLLKPLPTG